MFSREERNSLDSLSLELYGSSSRWQKLLKDPQFRVTTGVHHDENARQYVQFSRKRGDNRPGTTMRKEKALELGLIKEDPAKGEKGCSIPITREPTYEELLEAMRQNLDATLLSVMSPNDLRLVLAYRYVNGSLNRRIALAKSPGDEKYNKDLNVLLASISEEPREELKKMIVNAPKDSPIAPLDAMEFVTDYIFVKSNDELAQEQMDIIMKEARTVYKKHLNSMPGLFLQQQLIETRTSRPTRKATKKKTMAEMEEEHKKLNKRRKLERQRRKDARRKKRK
jgi:hypothetical protein